MNERILSMAKEKMIINHEQEEINARMRQEPIVIATCSDMTSNKFDMHNIMSRVRSDRRDGSYK